MINKNWKKVKFSEVVEFPPLIKLKKGEQYPFVELSDIDIGFKYVYSKQYKIYNGTGAKFENGDTLFARITPSLENGKIAQVKNLTNKAFGSGEFFVFRGKKDITDSDFIYYLSQTQAFRDHAINSMVGASGRQRADNKFVARTEFLLPPLHIQKKIARMLSNYDNLIENNLTQIKLLEEKVRLTYEEWILKFQINGNSITIDNKSKLPSGWRLEKIGNLVDYHIGGGWGEEEISSEFSESAFVIRGTDFENILVGYLENIPFRYHKHSNLLSRNLKHKDIIFEVSGGSSTEGVAKTLQLNQILLDYFNNDVMCASFCKLIRTKSDDLSNLLFLFLQYLRDIRGTEVYELRSASNIVNYNWSAFLKFQETIVPDNETIKLFNLKIDPMMDSIYNLAKQNILLRESRNILLPRLMTGMIDVENMDIEV